jgi:hypothetical protein
MISNLPAGTPLKDVETLVNESLLMTEACVVNAKGTVAYVVFVEPDTVVEAVDVLNNKMFDGQKLKVAKVPIGHQMVMAGLLKLKLDEEESVEKPPVADIAQLVLQLKSLKPDQLAEVAAAAPLLVAPKTEPEPQAGFLSQLSAAGLGNNTRLPFFSGDEGNKQDVSYQQWSCEVRSLVRAGVQRSLILQAARRSLRGTAATILLQLGDGATVEKMLEKLDLFFGNVLTVEQLYGTFYVAEQSKTELIASWALRVEDLLSNLAKKDCSVAVPGTREKMLRSRFFVGLRADGVKEKIRHLYDGGSTYHQLVLSARAAELEQGSKARVQQESVTLDNGMSKKLDLIMAKLNEMSDRVNQVEAREKAREERSAKGGFGGRGSQSQDARSQNTRGRGGGYASGKFTGTCYACGQVGHRRDSCPEN